MFPFNVIQMIMRMYLGVGQSSTIKFSAEIVLATTYFRKKTPS